MHITPYPGCILVKLLEEKSKIDYGIKEKGRIFHGEVLEVGEPEALQSGKFRETPIKKGDILYFLSYEGSYDNFIDEKGDKYYLVLFGDCRGYKRV